MSSLMIESLRVLPVLETLTNVTGCAHSLQALVGWLQLYITQALDIPQTVVDCPCVSIPWIATG